MIYRVVFKVGYYEAFFDFVEALEACAFAKMALEHSVMNEDTNKAKSITLLIVDTTAEKEDE